MVKYKQSVKVLTARAAMLRGVLEARLEASEGPIAAGELAPLIGICSDNREANRRLVRGVVAYAREQKGVRICADSHGCWLAQSADEWAHYQAAVATKAKFAFVRIARTQRAASEAISEQGKLFDAVHEGSREAAWSRA